MSPHEVTYEVVFYVDENGTKPVAVFLRSLANNPNLADRIKSAIRRLEDGRWHRQPETKSLGSGLYEVRVLGSDGARVLFFYSAQRQVVVVHAFQKKSQKIPERVHDGARAKASTPTASGGPGGMTKSAFQQELDEIFDGIVDDREVAKWGTAIDIATQFYALRERRGLTHAQVGEQIGKTSEPFQGSRTRSTRSTTLRL